MDNFEKFITVNRDQLDLHEPSPDIWETIIRRSRKRKLNILLGLSAAAIITILAGISILFYMNHKKGNATLSDSLTGQQELKETEIFYTSMFNRLYTDAKPLLTGQPDIEKELSAGVAQIDSICADIRKDLKDNISNREVIEALIRNYRIKIILLEDMMNIVRENEKDNETKKSHEL